MWRDYNNKAFWYPLTSNTQQLKAAIPWAWVAIPEKNILNRFDVA